MVPCRGMDVVVVIVDVVIYDQHTYFQFQTSDKQLYWTLSNSFNIIIMVVTLIYTTATYNLYTIGAGPYTRPSFFDW